MNSPSRNDVIQDYVNRQLLTEGVVTNQQLDEAVSNQGTGVVDGRHEEVILTIPDAVIGGGIGGPVDVYADLSFSGSFSWHNIAGDMHSPEEFNYSNLSLTDYDVLSLTVDMDDANRLGLDESDFVRSQYDGMIGINPEIVRRGSGNKVVQFLIESIKQWVKIDGYRILEQNINDGEWQDAGE